jgi:preprotein translocase subunit Sec61beta
MMTSSYTAILFIALVAAANAFAPSEMPSARKSAASTSYAQMKRVSGFGASFNSRNRVCNGGVCRMASGETDVEKLRAQAQKLREEAAEAAGVSVEELTAASKPNADGTVYDDEPMLEPIRDPLSDSMRERLRREASTGLDSNKSQTNVILYISVAVALLVLAGGQGILY